MAAVQTLTVKFARLAVRYRAGNRSSPAQRSRSNSACSGRRVVLRVPGGTDPRGGLAHPPQSSSASGFGLRTGSAAGYVQSTRRTPVLRRHLNGRGLAASEQGVLCSTKKGAQEPTVPSPRLLAVPGASSQSRKSFREPMRERLERRMSNLESRHFWQTNTSGTLDFRILAQDRWIQVWHSLHSIIGRPANGFMQKQVTRSHESSSERGAHVRERKTSGAALRWDGRARAQLPLPVPPPPERAVGAPKGRPALWSRSSVRGHRSRTICVH